MSKKIKERREMSKKIKERQNLDEKEIQVAEEREMSMLHEVVRVALYGRQII